MTTQPASLFTVLPEGSVQITPFPLKGALNSIWDFYATPDRRFFAALCGEFHGSDTAILYEYDPASGTIAELFDVGPVCLHTEGVIPPSKIHTSIQSLDERRLIMATHTTAPASNHPAWLFDGYFADPWEGFPGSHVLVYDLKTRRATTLGIPVQRESIYGAILHHETDSYWFTGFLKGHLYRMNLGSREIKDYGQITEYASYKLSSDLKGNIYTSSRSGHLFRINPFTEEISDLGLIPDTGDRHPLRKCHRILAHSVNGPDGRMYFVSHFSNLLFAIDPTSNQIDVVGECVPEFLAPEENTLCSGLAVDSAGCFWLAQVYPFGASSGFGQAVYLTSWDLHHRETPVCRGMIGTSERVAGMSAKLLYDKASDSLFLADTNHGPDPAAIHKISLAKVRTGVPNPAQIHDPLPYGHRPDLIANYPGRFDDRARPCIEFEELIQGYIALADGPAKTSILCESSEILRLWEVFGRGNACVYALRSDETGFHARLQNTHGEHQRCLFINLEGDWSESPYAPEEQAPNPRSIQMPANPGRGHLGVATAHVSDGNGQSYWGTADGLLVTMAHGERHPVNCGAAIFNGPIRALAADSRTGGVYGVGGHSKDLGMLFFYHKSCGLHRLGRLQFSTFNGPATGGPPAASSQPVALAVSLDGSVVAVGVQDALGCVYLLRNVKTPLSSLSSESGEKPHG